MMEIEFSSRRHYFVQLLVEHRHRFLLRDPLSGQMTCAHLKLNQNCPDRPQCLMGLKREEEVTYCLATSSNWQLCWSFKIKVCEPHLHLFGLFLQLLGLPDSLEVREINPKGKKSLSSWQGRDAPPDEHSAGAPARTAASGPSVSLTQIRNCI